MGLFKRKKSRQEKVTATDIDAITDAAAETLYKMSKKKKKEII